MTRLRERARPLIELLAMLALVQLDLWLPSEAEPWRWLARAAAVALWILSFRRRRGCDAATASPLGRAWGEAALATLLIAAALVAWLVAMREPYDEPTLGFLGSASSAVIWSARRLALAALQQVFLQLFFFAVLRELLRPAPAAWAAAAIFGLCHLPSPALAVGTSLMALVWILLYHRCRRLAPIILSHALLAALASVTVPERLFYELRPGARAMENLPAYRLLAHPDTRSLLRQLTSDEYLADHGGTLDGYLRGLFRDLLGRPATAGELADWTERVTRTSRAAVAKALITSEEASTFGPLGLRFLDPRPVSSTAAPLRYPAVSIAWVDDPYFLEGFSVAEENLRWTAEPVARLVYPIHRVTRERPYVLRLTAGALGRQRVAIAVSAEVVAELELDGMRPQVVSTRFDAGLLRPGENTVELHLPDATTTEDDPRQLGLAFVTLSIHPAGPATDGAVHGLEDRDR